MMDTSISQSHEQDFQSNSTDADNPKQFDHGESATCLQQANMLDDYTSGRDVHIGKPQSLKRGERNNEGLLAVISQWIVEHQTGLAINLLLLLTMTHACFPRARRRTRKFFHLSYYNPHSQKYTLGEDDMSLVFFWIVVFTGLRAAVMEYVLMPIAQMAGILKAKEKTRFAEQAWIFVCAAASFSLGMYIMYHSKYWLDLHHLWTGWPNRELSGLVKWYYLVEFAFWIQQILVVNIEKRRKDHAQMFTHHIITCILIASSYVYHQTNVGNLIMCLMDVVDLFLACAKILKYLRFHVACDVAFGVFIVVWFVARQILYPIVCYSVYAHIPENIKYGCYWGSASNLQGPVSAPDYLDHLLQPFRDPEGLVCWDNKIKWMFLTALLALQALLLVWFGMILKVASKVIRGGKAEDSRSDDEEFNEEDDDEEISHDEKICCHEGPPMKTPPLQEKVVGVEGLHFTHHRTGPVKRFRKGGSAASGVTISSDRKELLGRIGCDKGL